VKVNKMAAVRPMPPVASSINVVPPDVSRCRGVARHERELSKEQTELQEPRGQSELRLSQMNDLRALREVFRELHLVSEDAAVRIARLTSRQHEVMQMVLAGEASKVIAWKLGISQRTVDNHRAGIMKKTRSTSIPGLACLAVAARWNDAGKIFVKFLTGQALEADRKAIDVTRPEGDHDTAPSDAAVCPAVHVPAAWSQVIDSRDSARGTSLNMN
jgi:DNA-binding CsgD family transcriptional regulator